MGEIYTGFLSLEVGEIAYDERVGMWVGRALPEDVPFSCGFDCCGTAEHAVMAFHSEKEAQEYILSRATG